MIAFAHIGAAQYRQDMREWTCFIFKRIFTIGKRDDYKGRLELHENSNHLPQSVDKVRPSLNSVNVGRHSDLNVGLILSGKFLLDTYLLVKRLASDPTSEEPSSLRLHRHTSKVKLFLPALQFFI